MKRLTLKTEQQQTTDIFVGSGLKHEIIKSIQAIPASSIIYVTEEPLKELLNEYLQPGPENIMTFPSGENQKSLANVTRIIAFLKSKKASKNTLVVSFGGGVVSDLAGFAASIYNRGIPLVCIPTTLLAMIDASIGGKNGVNFKETKNLIGTIHNPKAIFADTDLLKSLPEQDLLSGLGELAKYAICMDSALFALLQQPFDKNMEAAILRGIQSKVRQVELDPYENSAERQMLNFGHSLGHALESCSDFRLKHGLAVAIGCNFACFISKQKGYISTSDYQKIADFIEKLGLPLMIDFEIGAIMKFIEADKKKLDEKTLNFVLIKSVGSGIVEPLSFTEIEKYLIQFKEI